MKRLVLLIVLLTRSVWAQELLPDFRNHFSASLGFTDLSQSFGGTLAVTSPYFLNEHLAVRLNWLAFRQTEWIQDGWKSFDVNVPTLDLVVGTFLVDRLRGYWRIGLGVLIPPDTVSSKVSFAAAGALGLEFFPTLSSRFSIFGEVGGLRSPSAEARYQGQPFHFTQGVTVTTGVTIHI